MAQKLLSITCIALTLLGMGCSGSTDSIPTAVPIARITEPSDSVPTPTIIPATPLITPTAIPPTTAPPTATRTRRPTRTPRPTQTATPAPTDTASPAETETATEAATRTPTNTATATPEPTETATPRPTRTQLVPTESNTPTPVPTDTPEPSPTVAAENDVSADTAENGTDEADEADDGANSSDSDIVAEIVAIQDATLFSEPNPLNGEEARLGYFVPADGTAQVIAASQDGNWLEVLHPLGGRGWVSADRFDLSPTELAALPSVETFSSDEPDEPIVAVFELPDVPPTATFTPITAPTDIPTPILTTTIPLTPTVAPIPTATLLPTIPPTETALPTITLTTAITPTPLPPTITPTATTIPTAFPTVTPTAAVTPTATLLPTIPPTAASAVITPTPITFATSTPPPLVSTDVSPTPVPPTLPPTSIPPTDVPPTSPPPAPASPPQNAGGTGIYEPPPNSIPMNALEPASIFVRQNPRRDGDHTGYGVPPGNVVYALGKGEQSYWVQIVTPGRNGAADAIYGWVSSGLFDISRAEIDSLPSSGFVVQGYPEVVPTQSFGRAPDGYVPPVDAPVPSFATVTPIGYVPPPPTDTPDPNAPTTIPTSVPTSIPTAIPTDSPRQPAPNNPNQPPTPQPTVRPDLPPEELARPTSPPPPDIRDFQPSPTPTPGRDVLDDSPTAADLPAGSALAFWRILPNSIQTRGAGWTAQVQVRVPTGSTYTFQVDNGQSARRTRANIDGDDFYAVTLGNLPCGQQYQSDLYVVQNGRLRLPTRNDDTFGDIPVTINAPC